MGASKSLVRSRLWGARIVRISLGFSLAACVAGMSIDASASSAPRPGQSPANHPAASDSEVSGPTALFARALEVPASSVLEVVEIEADRRIVGVIGRFRDGSRDTASTVQGAIVQPLGERAARLGPADEIWFAGLVDLEADTKLALGRRTPKRLRSAGLARPALVLLTRYKEAVAPNPKLKTIGSRFSGTRLTKHLFLVELEATANVLLTLETEYRSEDGFGGHDVGGLALRQQGGKTYLEGVRQDHLPASRARCLKPEPYTVRFELAGRRFRELPVERPLAPCG